MAESANAKDPKILAGRYALGEFIGQGGMATVYRGTDIKLGRQVAIKVMKAELSEDDQFRSRFRQEAQSASRMAHPTVVRVFDAGDDLIQTADGVKRLPFIVMEYLDGTNLRQLIDGNRLSQTEAARIVEAVLTALEYSHRAGIVHRDIKPANIMITKSGQVKVMDFGIARAVSETSSTLQQTTAILGTAAYFSPEQAKGEAVDARTDLYSTAVLLYELLAGEVPFKGDSAVAVAYQHVSERPQPPSTRNPEISPEFDRVVLHGLGKDRGRRFQTAAEFRDALRQAASGTMPALPSTDTQDTVLFQAGDDITESELALRQLAEGGGTRTQSRPPVMWTWAAILTVGAVVVAVVIWLMNLVPSNLVPSNVREVPEFENTTISQALEELEKLGLEVKQVEQTDEEVPAGTVLSTKPEAGAKMVVGEEIVVYVSSGPKPVEVPDYSGLTLEAYIEALKAIGLDVGQITTVDDPVAPANRILEVSPGRGEKVQKGGTVDVSISSGKVNIERVVGQPLDVARNLLGGLGLSLALLPQTSCQAEPGYLITSQSIVGPSPQGSRIELTYCIGN